MPRLTEVCPILSKPQLIVSALPDEPRQPQDPVVQRLLIEGAQKLELRVQASVKAEAEILYK